MQWKRRRRAAIAVLSAALLSVFCLGGGTMATAAAAPNATTSYYTVKHSCAAPTAHHATCFALRRVKVTSSTKGARAVAEPTFTAGPAGGYTPANLAKAYGVTTSAATTQTIGIVDAYDDPNALADLNTFDTQYGIAKETSTSFKKVSQTGSTTTLPSANSGWASEISLDLDAVRGLCNKCKIVLVEANSDSNADLAAGVNEAAKLGATIISNSYGGPEGGMTSAQAAAYDHSKVAILASTGDDGFFNWDVYNTGSASAEVPNTPSSLNTVVAVGGTTLYLNDDATRSSETVWNENGLGDLTGNNLKYAMGASGGGCSSITTAQKWQSSVANYAQTACGTKRLAADISAIADPYTGYDIVDTYSTNGTWFTYGGTSLATPIVAAMWGLAGGPGGVAYPSLSLYGHFKSDAGSVYDVTAGGNGYCAGQSTGQCGASTSGSANTLGYGTLDCAWQAKSATVATGRRACDAATGYDGPSGVGTPKGTSVFKALGPTAVITAPASITHGSAASFSSTGSTDPFPGGSISTYAWTWGDGTATSTGSTAAHTWTAAGTYTVTLKVTDSYSRTATVTKSVTVG